MKFTTARRLIKEHKRGKPHPADLIKRCHEVCHEHHDMVARGKAAEAEIAQHVRDMQAKLATKPDPSQPKLIPDGTTPEEFAKRQVKLGRQGRLDATWDALKKGKCSALVKVGPDGKPILDARGNQIHLYDSMGNPAQDVPDVARHM